MEARALFAVERAARPEIPALRLALALVPDHMLAHHLRNRQALAYLVEELLGKPHESYVGGRIGPRQADR
jgi:hypothetical protein